MSELKVVNDLYSLLLSICIQISIKTSKDFVVPSSYINYALCKIFAADTHMFCQSK